MIADELRRQADHFIELAELHDVVGRPALDDSGEQEKISNKADNKSGTLVNKDFEEA